MIGGGAHHRHACGEIDPSFGCEQFERYQSLVMIHGEHAVKLPVVAASEKSVGSIGSESEYMFLVGFCDGWFDYLIVLGAYHAIVAGMRIERQYGNAWRVYAEVGDERLVEAGYAVVDCFLGDIAADIGQ